MADLYETVEWTDLGEDEVAVVDDEHEIEAARHGTDENGEDWLQQPGEWTRGPMQAGRVEIKKR